MKKKQLNEKNSKPLLFAEQVPEEIWQEILSYLSLKELTEITTVSKFWNEQISRDSRWHELYLRDFNELSRLFNENVSSSLARKKYFKNQKSIEKLKSLNSIDQPHLIGVFKNAVKKNDLILIQVLFKNKILDINITFDFYQSEFPFRFALVLTDTLSVYFDISLVHYAAIQGHLNIVKLLLLHGADITKKVTRLYRPASPMHGRGQSRSGSKRVAYTMLNDPLVQSHSIKSLVCLGYAEHSLVKGNLDTAINYFEKSNQYDPKIISDYIHQVYKDKIGFKFNYDESLIKKLNTSFEPILNKANEKRCIIS